MNQNLTTQCRAGKPNGEILEDFISYRRANSKGEKTIKGDKMVLNLFLRFTKNKPLGEITEKDAESDWSEFKVSIQEPEHHRIIGSLSVSHC